MAKKLNVGLIGSGFMGKAHSIAYATIPTLFPDAAAHPHRYIVADVNDELSKEAAAHFGFDKWTSNWKDLINDDSVDVIDIVTPNFVHKEMAIAAAEAGKHVFCEKPLALNKQESKEVYEAAKKAGIKTGMGFNYRKSQALAFAKKLIDQGKIGTVYGFRGMYLNDWAKDPETPLSWRFEKNKAGSGVIGDQCTHVMDMARYLLGEIDRVSAWTKTLLKERPKPTAAFDDLGKKPSGGSSDMAPVDVDDACGILVEFNSGVMGVLESSRFATGRGNHIFFEINGSKGSIRFDWERNNELWYASNDDEFEERGYRRIIMGPAHPNGDAFWPIAGINTGYAEATAINLKDFLDAVVDGGDVDPNFEDGWRIEEIVDAALRSNESGKWEKCHE